MPYGRITVQLTASRWPWGSKPRRNLADSPLKDCRPGLIPGPSSGGSPALRLAVLCQREDSAVAGRRHQSGGWGANRPRL